MKTQFASISKSLIAVAIVHVSVASVAFAQTQSLWPMGRSRNMIANKVATQRGDILTIVLSESTTTSTKQDTQTSKESSTDNKVSQFLFSTAASGLGTQNGELPATKFSGKNDSKAGGSISSTSTLADRFSVMVVDVLPNGNLVLEGTRKRLYGGETQFVVFSGIARYWDITSENTVASNYIHNANVEFINEGELTDATKKGWLNKLHDFVNPF